MFFFTWFDVSDDRLDTKQSKFKAIDVKTGASHLDAPYLNLCKQDLKAMMNF